VRDARQPEVGTPLAISPRVRGVALEDRKTIERAKGVLMDRLRLTEAVAFRLLQKSAMDRRVPIVALVERLLAGEDLAAILERRERRPSSRVPGTRIGPGAMRGDRRQRRSTPDACLIQAGRRGVSTGG
jgi:ANTAR domain